jgi:hypothetical protein
MPAYTGTGGRSRLAPPFSGAISSGEGFAEPRLHRRADAYFPGTYTVAKSLGNRMAKLTICTNSRVRSGEAVQCERNAERLKNRATSYVGIRHVFFERIGLRRRRPLYQADTMHAGPRYQAQGGRQQVRVGPVSVSQRQVSQPDSRLAVEVQFDGDGLALDQAPEAPTCRTSRREPAPVPRVYMSCSAR